MKPLRIATALVMLATPAYASSGTIDKSCMNIYEKTFGFTQAKLICTSVPFVKSDELGWSCECGRKPLVQKDTKGGIRFKRDAICICE